MLGADVLGWLGLDLFLSTQVAGQRQARIRPRRLGGTSCRDGGGATGVASSIRPSEDRFIRGGRGWLLDFMQSQKVEPRSEIHALLKNTAREWCGEREARVTRRCAGASPVMSFAVQYDEALAQCGTCTVQYSTTTVLYELVL